MSTLLASLLALHLASQSTADLDTFYREWMGAGTNGAEAYASFYATDGVLLPPNMAPVVGRAAIAEWFLRTQAEAPYTTKPEGITVDEVKLIGQLWAVHRGTLRGMRIPKAGGPAVPFETKYFDLLHRTEKGGWEVAYRMWSDNLGSQK